MINLRQAHALRTGLIGLTAAIGILAAGTGASSAQSVTQAHISGMTTALSAASDANSAQSEIGRYLVDGARIHTQPSTGSTTVGYGYTSHSVTVICRRVVSGSEWYYHTDNTTHVTGWGRYDVVLPYLQVGDC